MLEGTTEVDELMLTGESVPVLAGNSIVSGTVNGGGRLTARVSRLPGRNTVTDIANLVDQAQSFKSRVQDLADKVAGYFIPVVCTVALIVFVIWVFVVLNVRKQPAGDAIGTAIGYCIAVLAISFVRNTLGGNDLDMLCALLTLPAPCSRRYGDDITVEVVFFGEDENTRSVVVNAEATYGNKRG